MTSRESQKDDALASLIAMIADAEARGESIDPEGILRSHPGHEQSLREFFANIDKIRASGKGKPRSQTPPAFQGDGCLIVTLFTLGMPIGGTVGWQFFERQLKVSPQTEFLNGLNYIFWGAIAGPVAILVLWQIVDIIAKSVRRKE